jgi:hypothetical protein
MNSRIEPRFVNSQRRIHQQSVAIETLDVVAFVRAAVAPDVRRRPRASRAPRHVPVTARPSGVVLKYVAPAVVTWNAPH